MGNNTGYNIKPIKIQDIWTVQQSTYSSNPIIYIDIIKDSAVKTVQLDKFGWLYSYIKPYIPHIYSETDDSIDIIGECFWAVINEDNDIECFGLEPSSKRMRMITEQKNT